MDGENGLVTTGEVEVLLARIPGISESHVVADAQGTITEIHVLAGADRPAKAIVRDVESAIRARYGIDVDHRRISVAQLATAMPTRGEGRLQLVAHEVRINNARGEIALKVTLGSGSEEYIGSASGMIVGTSRRRLAAEATMQAVVQALMVPTIFSVAEATRVQVAGSEAVLVAIDTSLEGGPPEVLVGTALTGGDETVAAMRAALDAVNRRVARFLKRGAHLA